MKKLKIKNCKHKILDQIDDIPDQAKCRKCGYVFGRNDDFEFFNLIENEYYDVKTVYIRKLGVTDEEIKESFEFGIAPL